MSIEVVARALEVPIGGNAKVVLLGLANHADPDGTESHPTIDRLATYAHCDRRTVQRHLRQLEHDGWIEATGEYAMRGRGNRLITVYAVTLEGRQNAIPPDAGMATVAARDGSGGTSGMAPVPSNTSIQPSIVLASQEQPPTPRVSAPKAWTYQGKPVAPALCQVAVEALNAFNAVAGDRLPAFNRQGKPTDHLRTITGAVLDFPEYDGARWREVVEANFANPWWDDVPGVGVVFGPAVRHRAVRNDGVVRGERSTSNGSLLRKLKAAKAADGPLLYGDDDDNQEEEA